MTEGANSLLRALAGGVAPFDRPASHAPTADRDTLDFGLILSRARDGSLRSGLPVTVPSTVGAVDRATGERLSRAADEAAAMGIDRALVLVGNRAFRVDIDARRVIDAPDQAQRAITGVDGVVRLPPDGAPDRPASSAQPATGPARVVRNTSLLDTLAGPNSG